MILNLRACSRRNNSTDAQQQEKAHLCEFGENFSSKAVSARGLFPALFFSPTLPNLYKGACSQAIADGAKRSEQTKCHSPILSIVDPWNRLKTSHLFLFFFSSPLKYAFRIADLSRIEFQYVNPNQCTL